MHLATQFQPWSAQFGPSLTNSYDTRQQNFDRETNNPEGRSLLTGPIPATPGFEYNGRGQSAPSNPHAVVRVHGSEARVNYKRATLGTGVPFLFEVQGSSVFSNNNPTGKPPKNHVNDNIRRIRRVARETRQRQATHERPEPLPAKELWQSKQYDHVQSKVKQRLDEDTQRSLSRPQSAQGGFLRAHENTGPEYLRPQSVRSSRRGSVHSSVNLSNMHINEQPQPDYVRINAQHAKHIPKVRKTASAEAVEQVREKRERELQSYQDKQKGRVPDYIERIKDKQAQDIYEERANAPDPDCPLGHVKVDNEQRQSTLKQLYLNRAEMEKKLGHLPIRNDSVTIRRTKEDIEKKIVELDEAITIFSKPKVFVRVDE